MTEFDKANVPEPPNSPEDEDTEGHYATFAPDGDTGQNYVLQKDDADDGEGPLSGMRQ